ncbi:TPA: hypothetical protein RUV54_001377 [Staphylococcus aureus]|uniref:hypothetical protein n=1 Tax=Staphylococcus aureus TaxID=1280 RepID=UPI0013A6915A|nr:hypothetical protein [Staphylococcus aureus]NDP65977.1 hypothetical protein [Staphylococcus aureus]HDZ8770910.1 hypothetical protein [Staphylococcus aureus]
MIQKGRKKPVEIEFIKYTGDNKQEIYDWSNGNVDHSDYATHLLIDTLEGCLIAEVGSYIVKGVEGEFYPVEPNIFNKTYEVID